MRKLPLFFSLFIASSILFYLLSGFFYRAWKFYEAPPLAKILVAANSNCPHIIKNPYSKNIAWYYDIIIANAYRQKLMYFGVDEILKDGELAISFAPIALGQFDSSCKDSSITLFNKFMEYGFDINKVNPKSGLSILHDSIINEEQELVEYWITRGANVSTKVEKPGSKIHGMSAFELSEIFYQKDTNQKRDLIHKIIKKKYNTKMKADD